MAKVTVTEAVFDGESLKTTKVHIINPASCPHFIFIPSHYRDGLPCKCYVKDTPEMAEWGYTWSEQSNRWEAE